jgi:hypothetical protein
LSEYAAAVAGMLHALCGIVKLRTWPPTIEGPPKGPAGLRVSATLHGGRVTSGNNCMVPSTAQAYVTNATVLPSQSLGFLTLWQDGAAQPVASTLNATDSVITSNMAIVQTTNGSIDAFASTPTQLLLDVSSYFAP